MNPTKGAIRPGAESYRRLDIFSTSGASGKTFTSIRLAQLQARARGGAVLIIDADLTGPCLGSMLEPDVAWRRQRDLVQLVCGRPEFLPEELQQKKLPVYRRRGATSAPLDAKLRREPERISRGQDFGRALLFCPSVVPCVENGMDAEVLNAIVGHERAGGWVGHVIDQVIKATEAIVASRLCGVIVDHASSMGPLAWASVMAAEADPTRRALFLTDRSTLALGACGDLAEQVKRRAPGLYEDRCVWAVNRVPQRERPDWRDVLRRLCPSADWYLGESGFPIVRDDQLAELVDPPVPSPDQDSACDQDLDAIRVALLGQGEG